MSHTAPQMPVEEQGLSRVLGRYDCEVPGPTFIALGGVHGNEPGGVKALSKVLDGLRSGQIQVCGKFIALAGNLQALSESRRFIHRDLNRAWLREQLDGLSERDPASDTAEDHEQRELLEIFEECLAKSKGPVVFMDLHSSSAYGASFACLGDTLANRHIAKALPIPMILGLEECIDGAVMEFFNQRGLVSVAVEGGQHDDPCTEENLQAAVWLAMSAAGVIPAGQVDLAPFRKTLQASAVELPSVLEVRHRQVIKPEHRFRMQPGYANFQKVAKNEVLANDVFGELKASENCRVLLPLYQGQGEDGFFLVREVRPFWLGLSTVLRRMRLDKLVHFMPGVSRHREDPHSVVVNGFVARWFVVQMFHLLGFRRRRSMGRHLLFTKRWVAQGIEGFRPR